MNKPYVPKFGYLSLKFKKINPFAVIPEYKTPGSAGFDFHVLHDIIILPGESQLLPSGLKCEIPEGFEMQIRQRSGMSVKYRNYLANSVGTIDSDYRGEIKFPVVNHTRQLMVLKRGYRIMQGIICQVPQIKIVEVDELSDTERGEGGFGSTDKRGDK